MSVTSNMTGTSSPGEEDLEEDVAFSERIRQFFKVVKGPGTVAMLDAQSATSHALIAHLLLCLLLHAVCRCFLQRTSLCRTCGAASAQ